MKRIHILHFAKTFNHLDFVDLVLRHADKNRFELSAAVYSNVENKQLPDYQSIHALNITVSYLGLLSGAWNLSKLLQAKRVDVLHTHHFYESVMGMIACRLVPSCKLVIGRHYHNEFYLTARGLKLKYYLLVEAMVNRRAQVIISPSSLINILLEQQGVDKSKIKFIPYGFDFTAPKYQPVSDAERSDRRRRNGWEKSYVIGNFSRHHPIKGQLFLLEAFSQFSEKRNDALLVLVGDGPLRIELESHAKRLGISERVSFTGWQHDPYQYLAVVDVVVHPTLQEAFPQIMIETLALEIPLIITRVSGATDIITDGANGLLVDPADAGQLLAAMIKVYSDPGGAAAMARLGRKGVLHDLSIENSITAIENVYIDVTMNKR